MDVITVIVIIIIALVAVIKILKMAGVGQASQNRHPLPLSDSSTPNNRNANARMGRTLTLSSSEFETGEMVYLANSNWPGDREYHFNYKKQGNAWRAYILQMPDLQGRSPDGNTIHTLGGSGARYICWDRPVETLEGMQAISRRWADNVQKYIHTGRFG